MHWGDDGRVDGDSLWWIQYGVDAVDALGGAAQDRQFQGLETTRESIHHTVRAMGQLIVVGVSIFSWNID